MACATPSILACAGRNQHIARGIGKIKEPTHEIQSRLRQALLAEHSGDHAEARRCFQAARALDPDNIVALLWLAWLAPDREESLVLFSRVLELDPKNERAHAGIRWARRRPAEAQAAL